MRCPNCDGSNSRVIDSRLTTAEDATRRRRECEDCQYRFTTYERIERRPILIIKKTGAREVFDRDKMLSGMLKALHRRPVTAEQIEAFAARVEHELAQSKQREVPSTIVDREKILSRSAFNSPELGERESFGGGALIPPACDALAEPSSQCLAKSGDSNRAAR